MGKCPFPYFLPIILDSTETSISPRETSSSQLNAEHWALVDVSELVTLWTPSRDERLYVGLMPLITAVPPVLEAPDLHWQVLIMAKEMKSPGESANDKARNMGVFLDGPLGILGNRDHKSEGLLGIV